MMYTTTVQREQRNDVDTRWRKMSHNRVPIVLLHPHQYAARCKNTRSIS